MATLVLSKKFSFAAAQDWDWVVTDATGTRIVIENNLYQQSFAGTFTFAENGTIYGTATSTSFYINHELAYSVTDMTADATKLQVFAENENDTQETYAFVLSGDDHVFGSGESDVLLGYAGNDRFMADVGDDVLIGGSGNDSINGELGNDTAKYAGASSNYVVTKTATGMTISDSTGADGSDTLTSIERLVFADSGMAFDGSGNGGQAYRVYQAAFNRTPDVGGIGFWMNAMDAGMSLKTVAAGFVASDEFKLVYGAAPTNADLVNKFYANVLHRQPEQAGYDYWLGVLNDHPGSVADVLSNISESPENVAASAAVIAAGFTYSLY